MSAVTSDDLAREWAQRLEHREANRLGVSIKIARQRVANRLGIAAGTLENLSRQRIKGVRQVLFARLRAAVITEIQHEIAMHTNELSTLLEADCGPGDREVQEVAEGLARLKAVMDGDAPSEGVRQ